MCDSVVGIESFAGSDKETNPLFKDYHGECICMAFTKDGDSQFVVNDLCEILYSNELSQPATVEPPNR